MKVYVSEGKYFMADGENVVELIPNKDHYLELPANSVNRRWVSGAKVDRLGVIDYGDTVKVPRVLGQKTVTTIKSDNLAEYLSEADREVYEKLVAKAQAARKIAELERQIAELEAKKAELVGGNK